MQAVKRQANKGTVTKQPPAEPADANQAERWLAVLKANQRRLTIAGGVLVVVAGAIWFGVSANARRESFARRELDAARFSAEAGNLPLAANDLSAVVSTYGGTRAGQEAVLLLAQVRLLQDQPDEAVTQLREFIAAGPDPVYRGPAYTVLGTALEEVGEFGAAGEAYEEAARASQYDLVSARLLLDAGRAYMMAADTTGALRVYRQILEQHEAVGADAEARLRLAELRQFEEASATR